jgi:hypothetical protein
VEAATLCGGYQQGAGFRRARDSTPHGAAPHGTALREISSCDRKIAVPVAKHLPLSRLGSLRPPAVLSVASAVLGAASVDLGVASAVVGVASA